MIQLRIEQLIRIERRRRQQHVFHPALHGIPTGQELRDRLKQKI